MHGRLFVLYMTELALGMVSLSLGAQEDLSCTRYIVKTDDLEALERFAASYEIELTPLITYPCPSEDVLRLFGDSYVVTIQNDEATRLGDALKDLPGIKKVSPNRMTKLGPALVDSTRALPTTGATDGPYEPNDPWYYGQWDKVITKTNWAWNITKGSKDVIVALLDTGVDTLHEDLMSNLIPGYNFLDLNTNVQDFHGHGTTIAGVIGAEIDNYKGIAGMSQSSIMPLKVVGDDGHYKNSDLIQGILYAADNGAWVLNMSLGGDSDVFLEDAVSYAWTRGCFLCAGAGNANANSAAYPAAYEQVMSVGASAQNDSRASYSNYGEKVTIFAPGNNIVTTNLGGGYTNIYSGTSLACPEIAGLAALVKSVHTEYANKDIVDSIISGADTIDTDVGKVLRMNSLKAVDPNAGAKEPSRDEAFFLASTVCRGSIFLTYDVPGVTGYTLTIFDAAGRMVYLESGELALRGEKRITLELGNGVYFCLLSTRFGQARGKVVYTN